VITIDKEFKELIPALSQEEFKQLEENIIKEGCRDSLVVWQDTLIDGHNRYEICSKHNITFNKLQREFNDREEVIEWIIRNQFGRRNLPAYARSVLALRLEDVISARAKENMLATQNNNSSSAKQKSAEQIETRQELAKIAGVSHDTISKVKVIEKEGTAEQKQQLMKGETKINTVYNEIKKKDKVVRAFKTCTICNRIGPSSLFLQTHNRCLECHSQISSGELKASELKAIKEEERKIPLGDEEIAKTMLPQIVEILNEFKIKINHFTYCSDLHWLRKDKELVELVKRAKKDIETIMKLMEV
jgi:DNA-binding XRE family transcriptional regulator